MLIKGHISFFLIMPKLKIINKILEYSLLVIAFYVILFTDYNYLLVLPLFPLFLFFKYMHWYDKKNKLNIPDYYYTLGVIAVYPTIIGEFFFEFYYNVLYYDKILHLVIPIYLVMVVNFFLKDNFRFKKLSIVLIVLGIASLWEMFEFLVDSISGTTIMQGVVINMKELTGGFEDTMKDSFFVLIGSIIGAFFLRK